MSQQPCPLCGHRGREVTGVDYVNDIMTADGSLVHPSPDHSGLTLQEKHNMAPRHLELMELITYQQ